MNNKREEISQELNVLRAGVLGANDGIISVAGILVGVAAANATEHTLLITGLSAILAGAFSMAGGEYVSVSTQADTEKAAIESEQKLLDSQPQVERQVIVNHYIDSGLSEKISNDIADELMKKKALEELVDIKFDLQVGNYTNPWHAAFSSFCAFIIGSILPFLTTVLIPYPYKIPFTIGAVIIALFITGYTSAHLGKAPKAPAVIRNVVVGMLTMGVAYIIGYLLQA